MKIDLEHAHALVEKHKFVAGEPTQAYKHPRLYIGQMQDSKLWEVWLIGFGEMPEMGFVTRDIQTLDEALRVAETYLKRHGHIKNPDVKKLAKGTV